MVGFTFLYCTSLHFQQQLSCESRTGGSAETRLQEGAEGEVERESERARERDTERERERERAVTALITH